MIEAKLREYFGIFIREINENVTLSGHGIQIVTELFHSQLE